MTIDPLQLNKPLVRHERRISLMFLQNSVAAVETTAHLYRDWGFWSFVVAGLAFANSIAGPVRRLLKATRLVLEVHPKIALDQTFGNPQANLYIDLRNRGGRDIRVNELNIQVRREDAQTKMIRGQVYFETTSSQEPLLLVPFKVKAEDNWAHPVKFYALPDRQLDQKIRMNISKLKSDIIEKRGALDEELAKKTVVAADDNLVEPFIELFNKQFFWTAGEYVITVNVIAEPASGSLTKRFRFVIYESEAADLSAEVEDYKHGGGVYYKSGKYASIFPPISVA